MTKRVLGIVGALAAALSLMVATANAETFTGPVKETLHSRIGSQVNTTTKGNICLTGSEACQQAPPSSEPGGFEFARGIAVNGDSESPQFGDVYVIDNTHRVQVLAPDGSFISTFGWDVNKTKLAKGGASQQELNECTAVEVKAGGECQPGVEGEAPGQFGEHLESIAVDPANGDVYVSELINGAGTFGARVQKFTADGHWVWELGKEVNETADATPGSSAQAKNLCTAEEAAKGVKCTGPAQYEFGAEPAANASEPGVIPIGDVMALAVGGSEDDLYAGTGPRIQEFQTTGTFTRQIPLTAPLETLAVDDSCALHEPVLTEATTPTCASFDPSFGDLYLTSVPGTFSHSVPVRRLDPKGTPLAEFTLAARSGDVEELDVGALAVDASGRLAASEQEIVREPSNPEVRVSKPFGSLLDGATGRLITEFQVPKARELGALRGLAYSANDALYGAIEHELLSYAPVHVAELVARPAGCSPGQETETDATFSCTLHGEVNPEGVSETTVAFQWGLTPALGSETSKQPVADGTAPVPAPPVLLEGLRPNQTFSYRLVGFDHNNQPPEAALSSEKTTVTTPSVVPVIAGEPTASFVKSSSVVLFAELNPENANTRYEFQYGACETLESCPGVATTAVLQSGAYGRIGATLEASGLQPATTYRYRLLATSENTGKTETHEAVGPEGTFTTAPAALPQASTGPASVVTATSAVISGTVNPDGQAATYSFQLGVDNGAGTQYGVVFSGPAGAGSTPLAESLGLSGLQPGTTYAYRIAIRTGDGTLVEGEPATFTTAGLPAVLFAPTPLPMLAVPPYAFPIEAKVSTAPPAKCKRGYKRDKHGHCVKVKRKAKRHGKGARSRRR
jgi:hypothetical protein